MRYKIYVLFVCQDVCSSQYISILADFVLVNVHFRMQLCMYIFLGIYPGVYGGLLDYVF